MMEDDEPVGRLLSRREVVRFLGVSAAAWLTRSALGLDAPSASGGTCVVRPQQTEGPYFVDDRLNRVDITVDPVTGRRRPGKTLNVAFSVSRLREQRCEPLPDAQVDLWQCDAMGIYSDVRDPQFNTAGQKFLRGYQVTDDRGHVQFVTIYPGWYPGRTVHLHFKIRTESHEFTSQLYFDDTLTDRIHNQNPYARNGQRRTRNANDGIYRRGGNQLKLDVTETSKGLAATFAVAMQL